METAIGQYNVYNIYDTCGNDQRRRLADGEQESARKPLTAVNAEMSAQTITVETAESVSVSAGYAAALPDYECGGETAMDAYLADPAVVAALHVKAGTVGMQYTKTATDLLPLYKDLVNRHPDNILIYSGDTDGCVPFVGTEEWTRNLGFNVTKDWYETREMHDSLSHINSTSQCLTFILI